MSVEPYRLIVVANRTCPCPGLITEIVQRTAARNGSVLVVAPALNSRLRHFLSDTDAALIAAHERLKLAVEGLRSAGIHANGEVGDADPLLAIEDAMTAFPADAIILSTWPEGASHWLERNLLDRARARFDVPIDHMISRYDAPVGVAA